MKSLCKKTLILILLTFISGKSAENKKWISSKVMLKIDLKKTITYGSTMNFIQFIRWKSQQFFALLFETKQIISKHHTKTRHDYVWRNTEARSCKHCCSGKTMSVTYFVVVFSEFATLSLWSAWLYKFFHIMS